MVRQGSTHESTQINPCSIPSRRAIRRAICSLEAEGAATYSKGRP